MDSKQDYEIQPYCTFTAPEEGVDRYISELKTLGLLVSPPDCPYSFNFRPGDALARALSKSFTPRTSLEEAFFKIDIAALSQVNLSVMGFGRPRMYEDGTSKALNGDGTGVIFGLTKNQALIVCTLGLDGLSSYGGETGDGKATQKILNLLANNADQILFLAAGLLEENPYAEPQDILDMLRYQDPSLDSGAAIFAFGCFKVLVNSAYHNHLNPWALINSADYSAFFQPDRFITELVAPGRTMVTRLDAIKELNPRQKYDVKIGDADPRKDLYAVVGNTPMVQKIATRKERKSALYSKALNNPGLITPVDRQFPPNYGYCIEKSRILEVLGCSDGFSRDQEFQNPIRNLEDYAKAQYLEFLKNVYNRRPWIDDASLWWMQMGQNASQNNWEQQLQFMQSLAQ